MKQTPMLEKSLYRKHKAFGFLQRTTTDVSYENIDWDIPVLIRYNVNNYIGLGAGLQNTISLSEKQNQTIL